jgi:hypothetical protein
MISPTWFRPWMALAAVIVVLAALLGVQTVRLSDAKADVAAEQSAHSETKRLHAEALAAAISQARQTENDLRSDLERVQAEAAKEKEIAKSREDALIESVRSGERRLRISAVCTGGSHAGNNPAVAGGGGADVQVAELDGQTSERILGVTIDGDRYIRERNACVAAYEAVRKRLNEAQ